MIQTEFYFKNLKPMIETATENITDDKIIELNVRGEIIPVKKSILNSIPGTALDAMFSGRHHLDMKDNIPFLRRDPEIFKHVI